MGGSPLVGIWANIILEVVCLGQRLYFNHLYNGLSWFSYFWKVILRCWFVFAIALVASYYVLSFIPDNFIILIISALLITGVTIAFVGMGQGERELAFNKVNSIVSKLWR